MFPKKRSCMQKIMPEKWILHLGERQIAYYAKNGGTRGTVREKVFSGTQRIPCELKGSPKLSYGGSGFKEWRRILMAKSKFQKFEEVYMDFLRNSD